MQNFYRKKSRDNSDFMSTPGLLMIIYLGVISLCGCSKDRDNPLDPGNSATRGDPFELSGKFSNRGVELSWKLVDNSGITGFLIYRGDKDRTELIAIDSVGRNKFQYIDQNLTSDTTYSYRLSARGSDGQESLTGQSITVTIPSLRKWAPLGTGEGVSGEAWTVMSLCVHENQLYVGGDFWRVDTASSDNIAVWDGISWRSVGNEGVGDPGDFVSAMVVYESKLIIGGYFGGNSVKRMDNSGLANVGSGLTGAVWAMTVYNNMLISGGSFNLEDPPIYSFYWCNSAFSDAWLDPSMYFYEGGQARGDALALAEFNDQLIVAGYGNIAAFTERHMDDLDGGISSTIRALAVYDEQLIAGGYFTSIGGISANNIAAWNGATWSALGSGTNGSVSSLILYNNKLIAAGSFSQAGGISAGSIASWDGTSWSPLGAGFDNSVNVLAVYDGQLVAGGQFISASGVEVNGIAAWRDIE